MSTCQSTNSYIYLNKASRLVAASRASAAPLPGGIGGIVLPDAMLRFHAALFIAQVGVSKAHLGRRRLVVCVAPGDVVGRGLELLCGAIGTNPAGEAMRCAPPTLDGTPCSNEAGPMAHCLRPWVRAGGSELADGSGGIANHFAARFTVATAFVGATRRPPARQTPKQPQIMARRPPLLLFLFFVVIIIIIVVVVFVLCGEH